MTSKALLLASTAMVAVLTPLAASAQSAPPRLEVELQGDVDALGAELGLFAPVDIGPGTIVYGSFYAGILPGNDTYYGAAGIGARTRLDGDWVIGGNVHYDALRTGLGNAYQQISSGLELLSRDYEFRLEGNLPLGTTANAADGATSVGIENGNVAIRQGYEIALYGLKAEAGFRLPVFEDREGVSLKLFAEGSIKGGEHVGPVYGLGARAELQFADLGWPGASLTLGGGFGHDSLGDTAARAFLRLSVPLGGSPDAAAAPATDPLYASVSHNRIDTRLGAFGAVESASFADGRDIQAARRIDAASGGASAINDLLTDAGEDSVVLVDGEIDIDDTLYLLAGQTLLGGGTSMQVIASGSGKTYTLANTSTRGKLVATPPVAPLMGPLTVPDDKALVQLADRTTIASIDLVGGAWGISGEGVSDVAIHDVTIADTTSHGLRFVDVDGAAISNVTYTSSFGCDGCSSMAYSDVYGTVTNAALYGVGLRNATITDFTSDGAAWGLVFAGLSDGSTISAAASNVTVRNATIRNTTEEAFLFYLAEDIDIDGFEIDNGGRAINQVHDAVVFMSSEDISVSNGSITGGINGLMFVDPEPLPLANAGITVSDVTISDTYRAGIFLNPATDITFRNVDIIRPANLSGAYSAGIYHYAGWLEDITNITYDNVTVRDVVDADSAGITFISGNTGISGDITITGTPTICNNWGSVSASTLLINGETISNAC